jgi:hypothetical protein
MIVADPGTNIASEPHLDADSRPDWAMLTQPFQARAASKASSTVAI